MRHMRSVAYHLLGEPSTLVPQGMRAGPFDHPDGSYAVAVELQPGQWPAIGALTHLLFNAGVGLEVVSEPVPLGAAA